MNFDSNKLSPRIEELLHINHNPRGNLPVDTLDEADIATLEAIIDRRITPSFEFSMGKAITALVRIKQTPDVVERLGRVLADESMTRVSRVVAATQLGLFDDSGSAQQTLGTYLLIPDRLVQLEVVRSIGIIGDKSALQMLDRLPTPEWDATRKQLNFSKALIAHRSGIVRDDLSYVEGVKRQRGSEDEMIELTLRVIDGAALHEDSQRFRGSAYGIRMGDVGFALQARKARWTVFTNREVTTDWQFTQVFERPWITALLARWDERTTTLSTQYVVLTSPRAETTSIMVVRRDGEIFYTGDMAQLADGNFAFEMRDVERAGTAPTNVAGNLTRSGVELTLTVPFGSREGTKAGQEVIIEPRQTANIT